jgi:hypothetical protein
MSRTKELRSFTNSPHTLTVLLPPITEKKVTRPDTNTPDKRWNMPTKLCNGRKKLTGSP